MNKRDREQLKASIAKDLVEGQGEHSPTRELLKQYAPLEGIVASPGEGNFHRAEPAEPVENNMACGATLARNAGSAWHGATIAPDATLAPGATLARYAMVKGELRVPNTVNFSLFPTLEPYAKAVYYQLFLLSHGFRRDTCLISLPKLASLVLMSQRKVQNTIAYLEKRGLIKKLDSKVTGPCRGNLYQVPLPVAESAPDSSMAPGATLAGGATLAPHATLAPDATPAPRATNKEKLDDDDLKENHHQRPERTVAAGEPVENHSRAAAPLEKQGSPDRHFALVRKAYEQATGNRWNKSDTEAYEQNNLWNFPAEKIVSVMDIVARRTPARINSLAYFVKEIVTRPDPRNRAWQKKQLEKIVRRVRDNAVGLAHFSIGDLAESVKRACSREGVAFDNVIFNELAG